MSQISQGNELTSNEIAMIEALAALSTSGAAQAIQKTGPTSFANVNLSGGAAIWKYEPITLDGDNKTFHLAQAPASMVFYYSGHQPQLYGLDFTGTINGSNKDFVLGSAQDSSLLSDQYAIYI